MRRLRVRFSVALLVGLFAVGLTAVAADARSIRSSSGYTGHHTHWSWAGPGVGTVVWTLATDFSSHTACGSSWAYVDVDTAWDSSALRNGAELHIVFWAERSDGRRFQLGKEWKITKPVLWPGHPAFAGQFRAPVYTPNGTYLKSAGTMSWIVNGTDWPPFDNDSVTLAQWTKSC